MEEKKLLSGKEKKRYLFCMIASIVFWLAVFGKDFWQNRAAYAQILYRTDKAAFLIQVLILLFLLALFYAGWKKRLSLSEYIRRYPIVLLLLLITVSACVSYAPFIEGRRFFVFYDTSLDTREDYLPVLAAMVRRIRTHSGSTWLAEWGFGTDLFNNQSLVFDPFNLLLYAGGALFGLNILAYLLSIIQILKIFLTGIFAYLFLRELRISDPVRILVAYICSMNGFLMLWGQHYFFGSAVTLMFLDFWLIERVLRGKRTMPGLTAAIAVTAGFSLYCTYMIALAALLYILFHFLLEENGQEKGRRFLRIFSSAFIGFGLSAVIILPTIYQLVSVSGRIGGSESVGAAALLMQGFSGWKNTLYAGVMRMFSNNIFGNGLNFSLNGTNYYEAPLLFLSSFFPTTAVLWFSENVFYGKKKGRSLLTAIALLITAFTPIAAVVFNMFSAYNWRYQFVLLPAAAWMLAWVLDHVKSLRKGSVFLGTAAAAVSVFLILRYHGATTQHLEIFCACCVVLFLVAFLCIRFKPDWRKAAWVLIFAVSICNMSRDAFLCGCDRLTYDRGSQITEPGYGELQTQAYQKIDELESGRAEREESMVTGFSVFNNSLIYGYEGASFYNTSCSKYSKLFIDQKWPSLIPPDQVSGFGSFINGVDNVQSASLVGIQYVLSDQKSLEGEKDYYQLKEDLGDGYGIYENIYAGERGILFTDWISDQDFSQLDGTVQPNVFWNTLILGTDAEDPSTEELSVSQITKEEALQKASDPNYYKEHSVAFSEPASNRLSGRVVTDQNVLLFVSSAYDKGWKAYINGHKTKIYRADDGFMAIEVPAGTSRIEFVYHTPWLNVGIVFTVVFFFLYLVYTYLNVRKSRKIDSK